MVASDSSLLEELGRIAGDLGPTLAPSGSEDLLRSIALTAQKQFGAAACSVARLTADDSELVFTTVVGRGEEMVPGLRMPSGHGIAGWVVMSGQPLFVSDLSKDPRWARDTAELTGYTPVSMLVAPIATAQRLLGVIEVLDRSEDRPDSGQDMELLGVIADQAALAMEGARAFNDFGRLLLRAVAAAAEDEGAVEALDAAARRLPAPDADMLELASLFGMLGRLSPESRQLAVRVVQQFVDHQVSLTSRRTSRRG